MNSSGASRGARDGVPRSPRRRSRRTDDTLGPVSGDEWAVPSPNDESTLQRVEGPTVIGSELLRLLRRSGWTERLAAARLTGHWLDIVGAELMPHCEPVRLVGRVLVVRAATPLWATQLRYLALQLTERVEGVLGPGTVKDVRIVVGPLEDHG